MTCQRQTKVSHLHILQEITANLVKKIYHSQGQGALNPAF